MTAAPLLRLLTRDPSSGYPLEVTRLECRESGVAIEGRFSLGWMGRLTPDQLDFVGVVLAHRANLQKVAGYLGVAYNTVRSRMDEVVEALGGLPGDDSEPEISPERAAARQAAAGERSRILAELAAGALSVEEAQAALAQLRSGG